MPERKLVITPAEAKRKYDAEPDPGVLLYEVERIRDEDLVHIHHWSQESGISKAEQAERNNVARKIEAELELLSGLLQAIQEGKFTLADAQRSEKFQRAWATLQELLHTKGLFEYLENKKNESAETGAEESWSDLLPSPDFDPVAYTAEQISAATALLAARLEAITESADENVKRAAETVAFFLHTGDFHWYLKDILASGATPSLDNSFSLLWVKTKEPKVWAALCMLVRAKREALYAILGKPEVYENSGVLSLADQAGRRIEIEDLLPNALHIALAHSAVIISDEESQPEARQMEKAMLAEFYGQLPEVFEYEAEDLALRIEVEKVLEALKIDKRNKNFELYQKGLSILWSKNPFFKTRRLLKFGHWEEFAVGLKKRWNLANDKETIEFLGKIWKAMLGTVGDLLKTTQRLQVLQDDIESGLRLVLSLAVSKRKSEENKKMRTAELREQERRAYQVAYVLLKFLNPIAHSRNVFIEDAIVQCSVRYLKQVRSRVQALGGNHDYVRNFSQWYFYSISSAGIDLSQVDLTDCDFRSATFRLVKLDESHVRGANFEGARFYDQFRAPDLLPPSIAVHIDKNGYYRAKKK